MPIDVKNGTCRWNVNIDDDLGVYDQTRDLNVLYFLVFFPITLLAHVLVRIMNGIISYKDTYVSVSEDTIWWMTK